MAWVVVVPSTLLLGGLVPEVEVGAGVVEVATRWWGGRPPAAPKGAAGPPLPLAFTPKRIPPALPPVADVEGGAPVAAGVDADEVAVAANPLLTLLVALSLPSRARIWV